MRAPRALGDHTPVRRHKNENRRRLSETIVADLVGPSYWRKLTAPAHSETHLLACQPRATTGAISSATTLITLIKIDTPGPEVSLKGSPTVSPTTAALCVSLPLG